MKMVELVSTTQQANLEKQFHGELELPGIYARAGGVNNSETTSGCWNITRQQANDGNRR
jgi:hypothetical protein